MPGRGLGGREQADVHRLVEMGIEESGLGDAVSRMGKRMKIRGVLRDALRQKSVGIIEEDCREGHRQVRQAGGHHRLHRADDQSGPDARRQRDLRDQGARRRDLLAASALEEDLVRDRAPDARGARGEGAPADILQCLTKVNIPMSQALMARADLIVATGGQPMVRAAYSSGTPAYGVGAGNSTMIIDETANIEEAARNTRLSKTSDFGSGCSADGNLIIEASIFDKLLEQLQKEGGYLATPEQKAALRKA